MYTNELYHHGIKGMKWGVRRKTGGVTTTGRSRRDERKIKKEQKAWDKNFEKNQIHAYNKAARNADGIIAEVNKKYAKYDFSDLSDPKTKKVHDQYVDEYMHKWDKLLQSTYDETFGKRPE